MIIFIDNLSIKAYFINVSIKRFVCLDTKKKGEQRRKYQERRDKSVFYGYCRISTKKQNLERQERNILREYPNATIIKEEYTGTTTNRPKWQRLTKIVKSGDTIIFDSVSRMSRNATEGIKTYFELMNKQINLVFIKERYIDTNTYKQAISKRIETTGTKEDILINAINEYLKELAKEQIKIAFEQAEKEVKDLQQRTKEGIITAKIKGKHIGRKKGEKQITKKSIECKKMILKMSKDFNGNMKDKEIIDILKITKNTFYKYKKELRNE